MKNPVWAKALKACADPRRARQQLEQLMTTSAAALLKSAHAEQARIIAALNGRRSYAGALVREHVVWALEQAPTLE